jgi:hypothetical protein
MKNTHKKSITFAENLISGSMELRELLKVYETVGLEDISSVSYMNRVDTKYLFSVSKLSLLLQNVKSDYRVLEIEHLREFSYKTVYFDTPELLFYKQHVTGKLNRSKVRIRTYESNGLTFLEIKQKSNKGRTSKSRLEKEPGDMNHIEQSRGFIKEMISSGATSLKPVINTGFTRITLVSLVRAERITIDYNLVWTNLRGESVEMPFLAIAEIKSEKSTSLSPFFQQLKKLGVRSTGFSKYTTGMALVNQAPKQNVLKTKILLLNKIRDEYNGNGAA